MSRIKHRRRRARRPEAAYNRHHLLFQRKNWNRGIAKELRSFFVYYLPTEIHNELHVAVVYDVPIPPPEHLKTLYAAFLEQRVDIDRLDVLDALEWLQNACDYEPFQNAIHAQLEYLADNLYGAELVNRRIRQTARLILTTTAKPPY